MNFQRFARSFKFAFRGLAVLFRKEQNFRVHFLVALVVIFTGIYVRLPIWQWCLVILLITAVFILEMLNTVFERLSDVLKPRIHEYIGEAKDIMSAAVLLTSIASAIIGLIIFVPYFFD